ITAPLDSTPFEGKVSVRPNAVSVLLAFPLHGAGELGPDQAAATGGERSAELIDLSAFSGDPPKLVHIGAVAPDILAMTVLARKVVPGSFVRYERQAGDEIGERNGNRVLVRNGREVGAIAGDDGAWLRTGETVTGVPLQVAYADDRNNYLVFSEEHESYATGLSPLAVHRKSKATNESPGRYFPQEHHLYLRLPRPLQVGKTYEIRLEKINLDSRSISYLHDPLQVHSEAVHVSQIGFRPDDPAKVAFLSLWMGTGGGHTGYREGMAFRLIDERTDRAVFSGTSRLSKPAGDASPGLHAKGRNFNQTDVYELDFSSFSAPGRYRVCVEGVGCSYPFPIDDGVWEDAFKIAARGFYHQRSGIALQEPYTDWTRPRGFHPDDGKVVYETTFRRNESKGQGDTFTQLVAHRTERTLPNAWGGYFDAGDWDR
ncbi:MAG: hypothetical protein KAX19_04060, partial [Candidatus Brocadiae bacterium]|nr:hypothetical protein [Candidatus Brocadiia bacterium]